MRALVVNMRTHSMTQGGSTITQQLARNMWLTREKTIPRKLKEMLLAAELERRFSKDEILEMYLNEVYYGHGAYGAKRAARLLFNTTPQKLTLAQCALLAGLPRSPIAYSPYEAPQRAKSRRHQVLLAMLNQEYITPEQFKEAEGEQLQSKLAPLRERGVAAFAAPYFTHMIIRSLCHQYGEDQVYGGGLQVYTTLDMRAQKIAEEELTRGVESLRRQGAIRRGLVGQGALAAVEVKTGNVLAMVGGVGPYAKVQYNRAHPARAPWGRQPGSSFKPYVWTTALENGYGPSSTFSGSPITINVAGSKPYSPKNYSPRQGGSYTLREALAQSVNLVSVRIVKKVGIETVRQKATEMLNIPLERIRPFYSLALGANEVSPLEQATGYCTFANGGMRPTRNFIRRITTWSGEVIFEPRPELYQVIRRESAMSMLAMLRYVVTSGTGRRAAVSGYTVGGKTGTTNSGRDVWWVGFSPDISAAVWVGNDNNAPMPRGSGGGFCAPIWARFMKRTCDAMDLHGEFPQGSGITSSKRGGGDRERRADDDQRTSRTVTVCVSTGRRATPYCPATAERTFAPGQGTPGVCTAHSPRGGAHDDDGGNGTNHARPGSSGGSGGGASYTVCAKSGLRAGPSCAQTVERSSAPGGTCRSCGAPRERPEPAKPKPEPKSEPDTPKPDEG